MQLGPVERTAAPQHHPKPVDLDAAVRQRHHRACRSFGVGAPAACVSPCVSEYCGGCMELVPPVATGPGVHAPRPHLCPRNRTPVGTSSVVALYTALRGGKACPDGPDSGGFFPPGTLTQQKCGARAGGQEECVSTGRRPLLRSPLE